MALKNTWTTGETFTASDQNDTANEILGLNASGTYASRPTAGHPGRTYDCTDNGNTYCDNGTTWDLTKLGGFGLAGVEPPSASWSTTTLGSATFAADKGGRLLTNPSASGFNFRGEFRTLSPTSNYTFTACLDFASYAANQHNNGLVLRNSTSGSFITFGLSYDTVTSSSGFVLRSIAWTNVATPSANYNVQTQGQLTGAGIPNWLRIRDNGTTRFLEYSYNGNDWAEHHSVGRTDFITPNQIGWGGDNNNSGKTAYVRLRSFSVV